MTKPEWWALQGLPREAQSRKGWWVLGWSGELGAGCEGEQTETTGSSHLRECLQQGLEGTSQLAPTSLWPRAVSMGTAEAPLLREWGEVRRIFVYLLCQKRSRRACPPLPWSLSDGKGPREIPDLRGLLLCGPFLGDLVGFGFCRHGHCTCVALGF